jgi:tetratricopeptide (TPR) repeat protein
MRASLPLLLFASIPLLAQAAGPAAPHPILPPALIPRSANMANPYPFYVAPARLSLPSDEFARGVTLLQHANVLENGLRAETDQRKRAQALRLIHSMYLDARNSFDSVRHRIGSGNPKMLAGAWNNTAYADVKLGQAKKALTAAEKALELDPALAGARENRAEALLALNRIEEAKQTYLELYEIHRPLANVLLSSMRQWIDARRESVKTPESRTAFNDFQEWVRDRTRIEAQVETDINAPVASTLAPTSGLHAS